MLLCRPVFRKNVKCKIAQSFVTNRGSGIRRNGKKIKHSASQSFFTLRS